MYNRITTALIGLVFLFVATCNQAQAIEHAIYAGGLDSLVENASHLNFPWMVRLSEAGGSRIWLKYTEGEHRVNEVARYLWSTDEGQTWSTPNVDIFPMSCIQFSDNSVISIFGWNNTASTNHTLTKRVWSTPTSNPTVSSVSVTLPFSSTLCIHRSLIFRESGNENKLLLSAYGKRAGDPEYSVICLKSDDGGTTWSYQSIVARNANTDEGYTEPVMARLNNGHILCIARTGGNTPLRWTRSTDGGLTWSIPVDICGSARGVDPELIVLSSGVLLASAGTRPGTELFVDYSGSGYYFEKVPLPIFQKNPDPTQVLDTGYGCGYTAFAEVESNHVLVVTTQSDFTDGYEFSGTNCIQQAYIQVVEDETPKQNYASGPWNIIWDCGGLPEGVESGTIFDYLEYEPSGTSITRDNEDGEYIVETTAYAGSNANSSYYTKPGVFNASVPSEIMFRIDNISTVSTFVNGILVRDEGVGYLGFKFDDDLYGLAFGDGIWLPPYVGSLGATFKVVTETDHNANLSKARLYYLDSYGWSTNSITANIITNSSQPYDSCLFGDFGSEFGGEWYQDLMYVKNFWEWRTVHPTSVTNNNTFNIGMGYNSLAEGGIFEGWNDLETSNQNTNATGDYILNITTSVAGFSQVGPRFLNRTLVSGTSGDYAGGANVIFTITAAYAGGESGQGSTPMKLVIDSISVYAFNHSLHSGTTNKIRWAETTPGNTGTSSWLDLGPGSTALSNSVEYDQLVWNPSDISVAGTTMVRTFELNLSEDLANAAIDGFEVTGHIEYDVAP